MNKLIIALIVGIFLVGTIWAGGAIISERFITDKLDTGVRDSLIQKNVSDVFITEMSCQENYCTYWITKTGKINSQRRISLFNNVCVDTPVYEQKEVCSEPKCIIDEKEVEICEKPVCKMETVLIRTDKSCSDVQKTEAQLLAERDKDVASLLGTVAGVTSTAKATTTSTIGIKERLIV